MHHNCDMNPFVMTGKLVTFIISISIHDMLR